MSVSVLLVLTGAALMAGLVAVLLGVTGGAALSPTHTPQRRAPHTPTLHAPEPARSEEETP